jgi:hypothetical protein
MARPISPKLYHITHVDNLNGIIQDGWIWSDHQVTLRRSTHAVVGMGEIKRRRLEDLDVTCYPNSKVGEYVPFYFCPRSIMLYILHLSNHPSLSYRGGQEPIVHLEADLERVVDYARAHGQRWVFTTTNAGARYTNFYNDLGDLARIDWDAIEKLDFRNPAVKAGKQAEFLIQDRLPWDLVERVGVLSQDTADRVRAAMTGTGHKPRVNIQANWYF